MSVLRLSKHIWQMVNAHLINFTSKLAYLIQKSYIPFFFLTVNFILNKIRMLFSKVFFDTMTGSEQIYLRNHQCIHISRTGSFRFHWWMYPSSTSFPSPCWIVWKYHPWSTLYNVIPLIEQPFHFMVPLHPPGFI